MTKAPFAGRLHWGRPWQQDRFSWNGRYRREVVIQHPQITLWYPSAVTTRATQRFSTAPLSVARSRLQRRRRAAAPFRPGQGASPIECVGGRTGITKKPYIIALEEHYEAPEVERDLLPGARRPEVARDARRLNSPAGRCPRATLSRAVRWNAANLSFTPRWGWCCYHSRCANGRISRSHLRR
jgi:hypothetical protein